MSFLNPVPSGPLVENARRLLVAAERELLDRVIAAGSTGAVAAAGRAHANLTGAIDSMMTMLGKLPHALANGIVDMDRGFSARRLTPGETAQVDEAFGSRIQPGLVRIVKGAGLSLIAQGAYLNGNPAITVGNTIYIRSDLKLPLDDLSVRADGIELLLHEYTHVVQYATLGFGVFGKRYLTELRKLGNADQLYKYKSRNLDWQHETLEGQAAIVGDYAASRASPKNASNRAAANLLRGKLKGTGIYGN